MKAAAAAAALPPTPQRVQGGSDRLVALTTSNVSAGPGGSAARCSGRLAHRLPHACVLAALLASLQPYPSVGALQVLAVPRQHHELVGLPLGAILSPLPSHALPTYALDPASCSKCASGRGPRAHHYIFMLGTPGTNSLVAAVREKNHITTLSRAYQGWAACARLAGAAPTSTSTRPPAATAASGTATSASTSTPPPARRWAARGPRWTWRAPPAAACWAHPPLVGCRRRRTSLRPQRPRWARRCPGRPAPPAAAALRPPAPCSRCCSRRRWIT